jgi:hypothetical protein
MQAVVFLALNVLFCVMNIVIYGPDPNFFSAFAAGFSAFGAIVSAEKCFK